MQMYIILHTVHLKMVKMLKLMLYVFFPTIKKQHTCMEGLSMYESIFNAFDITLTGRKNQP